MPEFHHRAFCIPRPRLMRGRTIMQSVIVVGAGFAGLSAARALERLAVPRVIVLEAGDRVGGRAHTLRLPGMSLELGTTWVHGLRMGDGRVNPVFRAAQDAGLLTASPAQTVWDEATFLQPGAREAVSAPEELLVVARALAAFDEAVDAARADDDASRSLGEALDGARSSLAARLEGADPRLADRVWAWRERLQRAMDGTASSHDVPAAAIARYAAAVDGEVNVPIPAGFASLAAAMADGLDVRFGQRVEHIDWGGSSGVRLRTASGDAWEAEAVVVTCSLGVLQASGIGCGIGMIVSHFATH